MPPNASRGCEKTAGTTKTPVGPSNAWNIMKSVPQCFAEALLVLWRQHEGSNRLLEASYSNCGSFHGILVLWNVSVMIFDVKLSSFPQISPWARHPAFHRILNKKRTRKRLSRIVPRALFSRSFLYFPNFSPFWDFLHTVNTSVVQSEEIKKEKKL